MNVALRSNPCTLPLALATLLLVAAVGCSNRQGAVPNPFLSADRVPPPSTKVTIPGAQPAYYPGDPAIGPQPGFAPQQTFQQAPPGYVAPPAGPYQSGAAEAIEPAAFAENTPHSGPVGSPVGIPSDDRPLRFAAVQATPEPPQEPQSVAVQQPAPEPFVREIAEYQPPIQQPSASQQIAAPSAPIRQVSMTTPHAGPSPTSSPNFSPQQPTSDGLPWNAGSAPRQSVPAMQSAYQQPIAQNYTSPTYPPNFYAQPVAPATRVRLPGYPLPQQSFVTPAGATIQQPANMGSVQITELPPQPVRPMASVASPTDGFRSRSTVGPSI